jgi:hypothetical protein
MREYLLNLRDKIRNFFPNDKSKKQKAQAQAQRYIEEYMQKKNQDDFNRAKRKHETIEADRSSRLLGIEQQRDTAVHKLNSERQIPSSINFPKNIINCEHKTYLYNYFGTCWYISIIMLFFFSDTTIECAQLNILEVIAILRANRKLPDKIIDLLKSFLIPNTKFFINDKLKLEYYEFLKTIFLSIEESLIQMTTCFYVDNSKCSFAEATCPVATIDALLEFMKEDEHQYLEKMKKKTKNLLEHIQDFSSNEFADLGLSVNVYTEIMKFLSIFLFESSITITSAKKFNEYPSISKLIEYLKTKPNIIGFIIRLKLVNKKTNIVSLHAICIYKCNNKFFQCDNHKIKEIKDDAIDDNYPDDMSSFHSILGIFIKDMTLINTFKSKQHTTLKSPRDQVQLSTRSLKANQKYLNNLAKIYTAINI